MNNLVAIVGRPNVGKSSLFNMLIGKRKSIVYDEKGITRDRLYEEAEWTGKKFRVIDTGGIEIEDKEFQQLIQLQANLAIDEAVVIIFVVDGIEGLTTDDELIVDILRKSNKPIIIAANKLEGNKDFNVDIYSSGFEFIFPISAIHGEGVGDLLDKTLSYLEFNQEEEVDVTKLSIIGRPNAGKSSLLNQLVGKDRSIVSPISGTTRDSVDAEIFFGEQKFKIIDTAGINKKSKLIESVEHFALARAKTSITDADVIILLIDNEREIAHFDSVVGGYAHEKLKPTIIVINKWDLAQKETMSMKHREKEVRASFKFLSWAPMIFLSAKTGLRMDKLKEAILNIEKNRKKQIKTNVLNDVLSEIQIIQPAQSYNGGRLNIKFARQTENDIPKFLIWVNNKKYLHFSYERFLENKFREYFGFEGTPIKFVFKDSKEKNYEK